MALPGIASGAPADRDEVVARAGSRRAVFLDRDGVLIRTLVRDGKPFAVGTLAELEILPGVGEALQRLRDAGFLNIVVTNQPDVGTGKVERATVDDMHAHLMKELALDTVKVCFHTEADGCDCRKPRPGMLLAAAREYAIDLEASHMVGDRWRDIAAAQAVRCKAYFVDCGYREKRPEKPYLAVKSLPEAADIILQS
jgi:D-glycero-D-manno-heptose 1,7-bisphosphate phosphatase